MRPANEGVDDDASGQPAHGRGQEDRDQPGLHVAAGRDDEYDIGEESKRGSPDHGFT